MAQKYENYPRTEYDEDTKEIRFVPCVYQQRYTRIHEFLSKSSIPVKKVIDFGCSELGFFNLLKSIPGLELIMHIDIDEDLLNNNIDRVKPLLADYLRPKSHPFQVQILKGSIAEADPTILDVDAVVCVELIEHLYPNELEELPNVIFGISQPKLAIFTTPNVEYNILFPDSQRLRHHDHKFEWTRQQFQDWANNLCVRYSNYTVSFEGIGPPPRGFENLGSVTQMAIFKKLDDENSKREEYSGKRYKLLYDVTYPIKSDDRSINEKILHEIQYQIIRLSNPDSERYDDFSYDDDNNLLIPLREILPFVGKYDIGEEEVVNIMAAGSILVNNNKDIIVSGSCGSSSSNDSSDSSYIDTTSNLNIEEEFWNE